MSENLISAKGKLFLTSMYVLLWPPFLILLTYTSHEPVYFDLWSKRLFQVIVVAAAFLLLFTVFVGLALIHDKTRCALKGTLQWLRRHKVLFALTLLCPIVVWLVAVFAAIVIAPSPELETRLSWGLLDAGMFVVLLDLGLLLAHLDPRSLRVLQMRLAAVSLGLLLTIGVIEVAGRFLRFAPADVWTVNPANRKSQWHNGEFDVSVNTNAQGLRAPQLIPEEHAVKYRIMVVGDSMTFGHGVQYEETYPFVTESILRDEHGFRNVEVINVSRSGAGPGEYLDYVRRLGRKFDPDLIVVGYFTGNDCPVRPPFMRRTDAQLEKLRQDLLQQDRQHVLMNLVTCRLLYRQLLTPLAHRWRDVDARITPGERDPFFRTPNAMGTMISFDVLSPKDRQRLAKMQEDGWVDKALEFKVNPWLIVSAIRRPESVVNMMMLREDTRPDMDREWDLCKVILDEILQSAKDCSADVAFLVIPHAYQIDPKAVAQLAAWDCVVLPEMIGARKQNDLVLDYCDDRQVVCIDPFKKFLAETRKGSRLFFPIDTHLTPAGQRLLGRLLADRLAQIIPKEFGTDRN